MAGTLAHYSKDGGTVIIEKEWTDAVAGVVQAAEKFALRNVGDRPLNAGTFSIVPDVDGDGDDQMRLADDDNGTMSPPTELTPTLGATADGGVWAAAPVTPGWVVTALNALGETIASLEVTQLVDDTTKRVTLDWVNPVGTTGVKVYRTDTPGTYGATTLRATLGVVTTFIDDGTATGAGTPPLTNTTGGAGPNFGTEPVSFGTSPLVVPALVEGEMWFYWVKRVVPLGTPEAGNDRTCDFEYLEGSV